MKKIAALATVLILACGKRGDPHPPVPVIPQATTDLVVTQRAGEVILSWSYPSLTTAGRSLPAIRRISVYRYEEPLPVSALNREPDAVAEARIEPGIPQPIALFSRIPTIPQAQFAKLSAKIDSIEKDSLGGATAGARLIFTDSPPFQTSDQRPLRLTYAVVTEGESARGDYSNLATIVPLRVSLAPHSLAAATTPEGVVLTWSRPERTLGGGEAPVITGYHVFRTTPGEPLQDLALPVTTVNTTTWTDNPPYGEHEYRVTAVATEGPPLIQSAPSEPVRVTFRDLVPPPPPASVTALLETSLVRLIWDPVVAPDFEGYVVYRVDGPYRLKLSPGAIPQTNFVDISITAGVSSYYEVTSVDKSGNESAATRSETIVIPKTP